MRTGDQTLEMMAFMRIKQWRPMCHQRMINTRRLLYFWKWSSFHISFLWFRVTWVTPSFAPRFKTCAPSEQAGCQRITWSSIQICAHARRGVAKTNNFYGLRQDSSACLATKLIHRSHRCVETKTMQHELHTSIFMISSRPSEQFTAHCNAGIDIVLKIRGLTAAYLSSSKVQNHVLRN